MRAPCPAAGGLEKMRAVRLFVDSLIDVLVTAQAERPDAAPALELAVLGYRTPPGMPAELTPLLPGATAERAWIRLADLAATGVPTRAQGPRRWVLAEPAGEAPHTHALHEIHRLLLQWLGTRHDPAPPIVLHCSEGTEDDPRVATLLRSVQALAAPGGNVAMFHCLFRGEPADAPLPEPCPGGETIDQPLWLTTAGSEGAGKPFLKVDNRPHRAVARLLRTLLSTSGEWPQAPVQTVPGRPAPGLTARTLWAPKQGNADQEWEDAAAWSAATARAAVTDGASEGIFVKAWARMLAESFVNEAPELDDPASLSAWLAACRRGWRTEIQYPTLRYTQQVKVSRTGGGATFLGLELRTGDSPEGAPHAWRAWAVGDACLFHVRANRLLASFPAVGSTDFGFAPALLRTLSDGPNPRVVSAHGTCCDDDLFVLATDAIAQGLLRAVEAGERVDWDRYVAMDEATWRDGVDALRAGGRIVNDDCTLLLVRVGPQGTETLAEGEHEAGASDVNAPSAPPGPEAAREPGAEPPGTAEAPGEAPQGVPPEARLMAAARPILAKGLLIVVLCAVLLALRSPAWAAPAGPDDELIAAVLRPLRRACARQAELRGIWIRGAAASPSGRALVLSGFVDQEEQTERLEAQARILWGDMPDWKEAFPEGVDASGLKVFPIRSKYLLDLRRDFAASDPADRPARGLLSQTRLDDVYYHEDTQRITFEGRCIDQDACLIMRGQKEADLRAGRPPGRLARAFDQLFRTYLRPTDPVAAELAFNTSLIQFDLENPAVVLQRTLADQPALDDVLFQEAWYDADGVLQFGGLVASEQERSAVAAFVKKALDPAYVSPAQRSDERPGWSLSALTVTPWRDELLGHLQEQFAKDPDTLFRHTRLDHASFAHSADGLALKLRFGGLCIHPAADAVRVQLPRRLDQESTQWLKLPRPARAEVDFRAIRRLADPARPLQGVVPERRALDGVRLDDAYFDARGRLAPVGLWTGPAQQGELEALVRAELRGEEAGLLRNGLTWERMTPVATRELLKELRSWAVQHLEAAFLETLGFDAAGRLTLRGFCKKGAQPAIRAAQTELARRMDELLGTRAVSPSAVALTQNSLTVVDHLRTLVPRDAALDGLRIDRGVYDGDGRLVVSGIQDHPGQAERLGPLLQAMRGSREWVSQLPGGWRFGSFPSYPLAPLLETLERKMPADAAFDGIIFTRAYYDARGQLVFAGTAVGAATRPGLEESLKRLLGFDARLGVHVALTAQPREPARAEQATAVAVSKILAGDFTSSVPLLNLALLHQPEDATAWYLRAACSLTRGDTALAERDLRRLVALEKRDFGARQARFRRLERLQGGLRMRVDALLDQLATEAL